MPNHQLARKILDAIDQHPDNFDMADWFTRYDGNVTLRPTEDVVSCNTTLCVAGWAAHLSGYTLINRMVDDADGQPETEIIASKDGIERDLPAVALELLGLESNALFYTDEDGAREWLGNIAARSN